MNFSQMKERFGEQNTTCTAFVLLSQSVHYQRYKTQKTLNWSTVTEHLVSLFRKYDKTYIRLTTCKLVVYCKYFDQPLDLSWGLSKLNTFIVIIDNSYFEQFNDFLVESTRVVMASRKPNCTEVNQL